MYDIIEEIYDIIEEIEKKYRVKIFICKDWGDYYYLGIDYHGYNYGICINKENINNKEKFITLFLELLLIEIKNDLIY